MTAVAAAVPEPEPDRDPTRGSKSGSAGLRAAPAGGAFRLDEQASLALYLAEPSGFDAGTVVEFLVRIEAELNRLTAARIFALADLAARDTSEDRWVAEEVGAALRWSPTRAMTEVKNAAQLRDQLPATLDRLAAGEITAGQARVVTEASYKLPAGSPEAVAAFDQAAADRCGELSEPQTRHFLRRQVLRADPAGAERRHRAAVADRNVRLAEAEDGMALLTAFLPAPQAVACLQRLDRAARRHQHAHRSTPGAPEDARTLDQLRADLFTESLLAPAGRWIGGPLADGPLADGSPADRSPAVATRAGTSPPAKAIGVVASTDCAPDDSDAHGGFGLGASVQVIVSAATLLGQDDEPGWLDRYGPITADTARRIAHDPTGTWRRLVTDPTTGQLTDVGTKRYRPPTAIRRHVELRDGTCRFPYCNHPATGCDLHHVIPYPDGPTSVENLHAVSRRHHRAKTHTRWRVTLDPDTGETTWTSPTGRKRTTRPPQRWTLPGDTPSGRPRTHEASHSPDEPPPDDPPLDDPPPDEPPPDHRAPF